MINNKTTLGRNPLEAGVKDAVHVAIVSCRAGQALDPGDKVKLNEHREAVLSDKNIGVVDPFMNGRVSNGELFWLVMLPSQVQSVRHEWDHKLSFEPPDREVQKNQWIQIHADRLGLTYEQLMDAANRLYNYEISTRYEGTITSQEDFEYKLDDLYDFWGEWAEEMGIEFENEGTACCPEYTYPDSWSLFDYSHLE